MVNHLLGSKRIKKNSLDNVFLYFAQTIKHIEDCTVGLHSNKLRKQLQFEILSMRFFFYKNMSFKMVWKHYGQCVVSKKGSTDFQFNS